jgi:hypothetical protein
MTELVSLWVNEIHYGLEANRYRSVRPRCGTRRYRRRRQTRQPAVVLIGGDKGGVGKTTVARTLLDYFGRQQLRVRAFDTEVPRGTLKRFHPDVTDVVDINHVPDQMRIFDTVNSTDATVSLIDVRAGLLSPTLHALRNIGFIEAATRAASLEGRRPGNRPSYFEALDLFNILVPRSPCPHPLRRGRRD